MLGMTYVHVRRFGNSLYVRVPVDWVKTFGLERNDLAFLTPGDGADEFKVKLVKLPVPVEAPTEAVPAE
jgi:hypothetical protein